MRVAKAMGQAPHMRLSPGTDPGTFREFQKQLAASRGRRVRSLEMAIFTPEVLAILAEAGRKLGHRGGHARAEKLSAKRRREIALKGAKARWKKWRQAGKPKLVYRERAKRAA